MSAKQKSKEDSNSIPNVLGKWKLSIELKPDVNDLSVKALNGGTLDIIAQQKGPLENDPFDMLTANLTPGNGTASQTVGGAIDANRVLGFIFLSNGKPDGIQYRFRTGSVNDADRTISCGIISAPSAQQPRDRIRTDEEDIGTWSATGGGGEDVKCKS